MLNFFKKDIEEKFIVENYDFQIDKNKSIVEIRDNQIVSLEINAKEDVFKKLCATKSFIFEYGIYPPMFYAKEIQLNRNKKISITENNQYDYELALYFMEHNDVYINLVLQNEWILIDGYVRILGKLHPLEINIKR